ncbi:hypothetical protein GLYMA_15G179233v4 [Glycine max]|nr:hypothetical protein GLYMA_15G179233v4 [Glycine max]KAH1147725.1 hypothetical protein GYH30_042727 [Glycine max]
MANIFHQLLKFWLFFFYVNELNEFERNVSYKSL